MSDLTMYDAWLSDGGPAALVIREYLIPDVGPDAVFFPRYLRSPARCG